MKKHYLILIIFISQLLNLSSQVSIPYGECAVERDSRYYLYGTSWNCRFLTYAFDNGTPDISGDGEKNAIRLAFITWELVTNINFIETCDIEEADIQIGWRTGTHGDFHYFDNSVCLFGIRLAHSFFPPPYPFNTFHKLHFDDDEIWSLNGAPATTVTYGVNCDNHSIDLQSVALHELGHIIGLKHNDDVGTTCVMQTAYFGQRRTLYQDDIDAAQSLYGFPENPIQGTSITCTSTSSTFSVCSHANLSYTWTVHYGLIITSGQGTNSINVQKYSEGCGEGNISVTISSDCDEKTFSRYISYCCNVPPTPYHTYIIYDEANCCYNFGVLFPNSGCYRKFHWYINGNHYYTKAPHLDLCIDPRIEHYFSTAVSIINDCGESNALWKYIIAQPFPTTGPCSGRSSYSDIEIFPNPSTTDFVVNIKDDEVSVDELFTVTIHNWAGKIISSFSTSGKNIKVDTSDFTDGQYYISLSSTSHSYSSKFVVLK